MGSISRWKLWVAAGGYAAVAVMAAALFYARHLQELRYPDEASGGMWAAGDAMLQIFVACLFMLPTVFLIWTISTIESLYERYSQFLLGLSLSAPVCLTIFALSANSLIENVGIFCLYRLLCSPFAVFGFGVSRWMARFDRAKKLVSCAFLVEALTLAAAVALLIHAWSTPQAR